MPIARRQAAAGTGGRFVYGELRPPGLYSAWHCMPATDRADMQRARGRRSTLPYHIYPGLS